MKRLVAAVGLVVLAAAPVRAQEAALYGSAVDGNLRNVLQYGFGGGISFTALYHARAGARVDAGWYEAWQHYTAPPCAPAGVPPCATTSELVSSRTPFDVQDAMIVVAPVVAPGGRIYVGAGVSHFSLRNTQIGQTSGTTYSPRQTASGTGPVVMVDVIGRPDWRYQMAGEATLLYHHPGRLRACGAGQSPPQAPFCGSVGMTELRLGLVYTPRWAR